MISSFVLQIRAMLRDGDDLKVVENKEGWERLIKKFECGRK